jgi:hypothetical protein
MLMKKEEEGPVAEGLFVGYNFNSLDFLQINPK